MRRQGGFTLFEIIFAAFILGLMSMALGPSFRAFTTAKELQYKNEQTAINTKLAQAIQLYAENFVPSVASGMPPGSLSAPCSNSTNRVFYSIYNPGYCAGTADLLPYLQQVGVPLEKVNDDGTGNRNVRLYQRVNSNLSQDAYMYYQGGPKVTLSYEVGVVYLTNCGKNQACNTGASTSTPPASYYTGETGSGAVRLTSGNIATWTPGTRDIGVAYLSTLPLQKKMLQATATQLERIRTGMVNYYASQQAANPSSTANMYPQPTDVARRMPSVSDPANYQGCREGWYNLDDPTSDLLALIGLGGGIESGRTAWGAPIQYCRDYDPSLTSAYNVAPHFAALRINRTVSSISAPDSAVGNEAQNAVISF